MATENAVNARKLQVEPPSSQDDGPRKNAGEKDDDDDVDKGDDEDREGDEDGDDNDRGPVLCSECKPPATSR